MKRRVNYEIEETTRFRIPLIFITFSALLVGVWSTHPLQAANRSQVTKETGGQFFIISSVDVKKRQIVLKLPTEVTELVLVTDKTAYLDEEGKPLQFGDLRAGDTVYVTIAAGSDRSRIATQIRKGPMTVDELHRRYLQFD